MSKPITAKAFAAALALAIPAAPAYAAGLPPSAPEVEIGYLATTPDLTLRRLVVHNAHAKGQVLLLHGFPETIYTWTDVATALGDEFEVHAFDWPGYGLSSRPSADRFGYAPADYARVLRAYIAKAGLDRGKLTIYATDIGALPALLAALDEPGLARTIVVGDFAPFDRPAFMHERLQRLKTEPAASQARADLNATRDDVLENAFRRGLPVAAQFDVSQAFKTDMARGWGAGGLTSADAFYHYYSHFTRDQQRFEANLAKLRTPVKVVWGAQDIYIDKAMGAELAGKAGVPLTVLPGVGHYPHLQVPEQTIAEIRAAAR